GPVAASPGDEELALAGDPSLRARQPRVAIDARGQGDRDAAAVDDGDRGASAGRVALDALARESRDVGDGGVEVGEDLEHAVAEAIPSGAGGQHVLHEAA